MTPYAARSTSGLNSQAIVFNKSFDEEGYASFLLNSTEQFKQTYRRSTMEQNPVVYFTDDVITSEEMSYEQWAYKCNVPAEQIYVDQKLESEEVIQKFVPEIIGRSALATTQIENGVSIEGTLSAGEEKNRKSPYLF